MERIFFIDGRRVESKFRSMSHEDRKCIGHQTGFALEISKKLILTEAKDKNMVFSPLSIHLILSLIASGSEKSHARKEFLSFLKSKSTDKLNCLYSEVLSSVFSDVDDGTGGPCLSFANGVWVEKSLSLKETFKQVVEKDYKAAAKVVDFRNEVEKVVDEVNLWAEQKTNGLIKQIVPPDSVDYRTRLIFANALYFKGSWFEGTFNKSETKNRKFHLLGGDEVTVPFMNSKHKQYVADYDDFKVLRLPYNPGSDYSRKFAMYMYLPNANDGLPDLVDKVCSNSSFLDNHKPYKDVEMGEFRIPKFRMTFQFEASKVVKELGLVSPFGEDGGSLTEMVNNLDDDRELYVSGIFQKSFIEVNEEGTEAAAISFTPVCGGGYALPEVKMDFVADHPFLFLIREEESGVVLFFGQVLNPLESIHEETNGVRVRPNDFAPSSGRKRKCNEMGGAGSN